MIIAGIDPGTQRTGFAVIEFTRGKLFFREIGVWDLLKLTADSRASGRDRAPIGMRLEQLHQSAHSFFSNWNPQLIGFEKAVSFKNISSAHKLSEARGVVRLAAHQVLQAADERLIELSPTAVKRHAAGWGQSSKETVLKSLALRFEGLGAFANEQNFPFDAFDALAIAWTAWVHFKSNRAQRGNEPQP